MLKARLGQLQTPTGRGSSGVYCTFRPPSLSQIHDLYVRTGAARELPLPPHLQTSQRSNGDGEGRTLGGTPDYEGLLRLAKKEMLFILSCDAYPRFCASPDYAVLLAELSNAPSVRADAISRRMNEGDRGDSIGLGGSGDAHASVVGTDDVVALALPPPAPQTWLERFMRMADMLPVCITLADVSCGGPASRCSVPLPPDL